MIIMQSLMSKWLDKSCYVYIINDVLAKAYKLPFLLCICNVEKHMNQKGFFNRNTQNHTFDVCKLIEYLVASYQTAY